MHVSPDAVVDPRLVRHPLGFLQVRDLPSPDELQAHYAERYFQEPSSSNYRASYSNDEVYRFRSQADLRLLAVANHGGPASGCLLDLGCGEGWLLRSFDDAGWDVTGVDYSKYAVEVHNPSILPRVRIGDIHSVLKELIDENRLFDVVNLDHVLEHVPDPVMLLGELHAIVAPQGILLVSVPNDGNAFHEELVSQSMVDRRWWIAPPEHLNYFTQESFRNVMLATSWDVLDLWGDFPIDWFLASAHANYVQVPSRGRDAHTARLMIERHMHSSGLDNALDFYRALAAVGLGRNMTGIMRPL